MLVETETRTRRHFDAFIAFRDSVIGYRRVYELTLHVVQIEQCGTGFPYCQIIDSIFGDVQMSKVKPNAKLEYEYINNFKVLQTAFKAHGIDKPIPVEKLVKCKVSQHFTSAYRRAAL